MTSLWRKDGGKECYIDLTCQSLSEIYRRPDSEERLP